jgi:putative chitinase
MVNSQQLQRLGIGSEWVDALNETFQRFDISTFVQQASFIGQCGHECGNFRTLEENLNYRAETLLKLWPRRFNASNVGEYARNPKKIANMVYSNRMGNRDEASGDGYRFRGRGCIQLTGHANYYHAGQACGVDFVMQPDLVATPMYAAMTAGWFWSTQKLNQFARAPNDIDYVGMTKKINGGTIGLDDRKERITKAFEALS